MDPALWERVKETFDNISDAQPEHRARVLETLDEVTRREVERMLASYDESPLSVDANPVGLPNHAMIAALIRDQRTLEEGELLLDRFEIRRFLGSGGMGEVYEAHDRRLGAVAIKTLRPELISVKSTIGAFEREVMRGRRVSHPNVCRTYDFWETNDAEDMRVPFFTMELLTGQTLTSAVQASGGLSEAQAFRIALEICSGLGAAHEAGVIHGDLKTGNVIFTEDQGAARVKITDFGLARLAPWATACPDIITPPGVVGTKHYLAPELMSGDAVAVASDIFALGVMLFYLRTARYPFEANLEWDAAMQQRVHPPSLEQLVAELGARWARTVAACIAPKPEQRPGSVKEVIELLTEDDEGRHLLTRRNVLSTVGILTCVAAGMELWAPPRLPKGKLRTLVEDLDTPSAPPAVARSVRTLLNLSLDNSKRIELVPSGEVMKAKQTFGMGDQPLHGAASLRVARRTNTYVLVSGYVRSEESAYRVAIRAVEPGSQRVLFSTHEIVTKRSDLPSSVSKLASLLRVRLGGEEELAQFGAVPLDQADTGNVEALEAFVLGLAFYCRGDRNTALAKLEEATRLDPLFAIAYAYQAMVLVAIHQNDAALVPAQKAYGLRSRVNTHHRLFIEYHRFLLLGDWEKARNLLQVLLQFFPDDSSLNGLLSWFYANSGQHEKSLELARRSADLEPDNPDKLNLLASALAESDKFEEAQRLLNDSLSRFPKSFPLLFCQAYIHLLRLEVAPAMDILEKLVRSGERDYQLRTQIVKARMLCGRWAEATEALHNEIRACDFSRDRLTADIFRYWLGQISIVLGDLPAAAVLARDLSRNSACPTNLAALRAAAEIAWLAGDSGALRTAVVKLTEVQSIHESTCSQGFLHMACALEASLLSNYGKAEQEIELACGFWPDMTNNWVYAELLLQQADYSGALARFQAVVNAKAFAVRFDFINLWVRSLSRCALCLEALERIPEAARYWEQFTRLWGSREKFSFTLG